MKAIRRNTAGARSNMPLKAAGAIAAAGLTLLALSGCSGGAGSAEGTAIKPEPVQEGKAAEPSVSKEPVTLSFYQYSAKMTDEEFQELVVKPVKQKMPNVTLELVREGKGTSPQDLATAGGLPDIVYTGSAGAVTVLGLNGAEELSGAIKKHNLDLSKYDQTAVNFIQAYAQNGQMYALPFSLNFSALFYNKDIFDKFGVGYPADNLTWEDAVALARKVARQADAVQYKGLDLDGGYIRLGEQMSLPVIEPKSIRAVFQTDGWRTAVDTFKRIKEIPGNMDNKQPVPAFEQDRNLAMLAGLGARLGEFEELANKGTPLNWDMAAMPTFKEAPDKAFGISLFLLMVSSSSKHKEEAFQVIKVLLGDEVQLALNKRGRQTSLKDPKFQQYFGTELQSFKGKHAEAIFKRSPAALPSGTKYDNIAKNELGKSVGQVAKDGIDANTALRQAEESANQLIEAEKRK